MKKTTLLTVSGLFVFAMLASGKVLPKDKASDHLDPWVEGSTSEARMVKEIRHRLVTLPYFGVFDDLGFKVDGASVTLVGQVTQPTLKGDAERVVKGVEGVTSVANEIEVLPLSPNDDHIRMAAYRAVYGDPALSTRYGFRALPSIHIIVKNGDLRLEGVVANESDKIIAGMRANGVHGVFRVTNELRIEAQ